MFNIFSNFVFNGVSVCNITKYLLNYGTVLNFLYYIISNYRFAFFFEISVFLEQPVKFFKIDFCKFIKFSFICLLIFILHDIIK